MFPLVHSLACGGDRDYWTVNIESATVTPSGLSPLGQLSGGVLSISGPLQQLHDSAIFSEQNDIETCCQAWFDEESHRIEYDPCRIFFLLMTYRTETNFLSNGEITDLRGLILQALPDSRQHERIGMFHVSLFERRMSCGQWLPFLDYDSNRSSHETVTIV
jgi:hypothetical protein